MNLSQGTSARACRRAGTDRSSMVLFSAILASLGSFLFGFDTAVISGTTDSLRTVFQLNTLQPILREKGIKL
jgi:hypothetical protein